MRTNKYYILTLLMLLSVITSYAGDMGDIGEALKRKYMIIRVNGSAISDTFHIKPLYNYNLGHSEIDQLLSTKNTEKNKPFVFNAKADSTGLFTSKARIIGEEETTHSGTITKHESNRFIKGCRLSVYFPKTEMIYVTEELDFKNYQNYYDIKVTREPGHPFKYSTIPRKLVIDALIGLVTSLMTSLISLLVLKSPSRKFQNFLIIFGISIVYWLILRISLIYYSIGTVVSHTLGYCLFPPIAIFTMRKFLDTTTQKSYEKLLGYMLISAEIIFGITISAFACIFI